MISHLLLGIHQRGNSLSHAVEYNDGYNFRLWKLVGDGRYRIKRIRVVLCEIERSRNIHYLIFHIDNTQIETHRIIRRGSVLVSMARVIKLCHIEGIFHERIELDVVVASGR